jgi:hypothetical protein
MSERGAIERYFLLEIQINTGTSVVPVEIYVISQLNATEAFEYLFSVSGIGSFSIFNAAQCVLKLIEAVLKMICHSRL